MAPESCKFHSLPCTMNSNCNTHQFLYKVVNGAASFDEQHDTTRFLQLCRHLLQRPRSNHSSAFCFVRQEIIHFLNCPVKGTHLNSHIYDLRTFPSSLLPEFPKSCHHPTVIMTMTIISITFRELTLQHCFGSVSKHFSDWSRSMCSICSIVFVYLI